MSVSSKPLARDSIRCAWRILPNASAGGSHTVRRAVGTPKRGEACFDRGVARAQRIIGGIVKNGGVPAMIGRVGLRDLVCKAREFRARLLL